MDNKCHNLIIMMVTMISLINKQWPRLFNDTLIDHDSFATLLLRPFPYWGWRIEFSISTFSGLVLLLSLPVSPSCIFSFATHHNLVTKQAGL